MNKGCNKCGNKKEKAFIYIFYVKKRQVGKSCGKGEKQVETFFLCEKVLKKVLNMFEILFQAC